MAALETDPNIGLLFTDIIMPGGMSGIELAVETRRRILDEFGDRTIYLSHAREGIRR